MRQLALEIAPPALPTLDNFVAGRNTELVERLRLLAAGETPERFVYLWGPPGCGRSHLLSGVAAAVRGAGLTAAHLRCGSGAAVPGAAQGADCLVLDDVDQLDPEAQIAAFHLYNALKERRGALVASGSAPPAQLGLREDLATRLAWGLVYQVIPLTDEEKGRALDDRALARGFRLPPEVRDFLLTRARRDIASLLALVNALGPPLARDETAGDGTDGAGAGGGHRIVTRGRRAGMMARGLSGRLALFDLDNTLLAGDSDFEWAQFLIEQGVLDREVYEARNQAFYDQYKAGVLDIREFLDFQLKPLSRHPRAVLDAWHREFMSCKIRPIIRPAARALVTRHAGDLRVLISATNTFVTGPIAAEFGISELIATEPEERDGEFTGESAARPAFARARSSVSKHGLSRTDGRSPRSPNRGSTATP
jgi:DnaA regulatory inactivator Hda